MSPNDDSSLRDNKHVMKRHLQVGEDADAIIFENYFILRNYQKRAMLWIEMFTLKDFVHEVGNEIGLCPANAGWNECSWLWR